MDMTTEMFLDEKHVLEFSNMSGNVTIANLRTYKDFRRISCIIIGIIDIVLIPLVLAGNVFVLFSIMKFKFLRTITNTFIASLSVADTLLGAITIPLYAAMYLNQEINQIKYACVIKFASVIWSMCSSLLSLVAISVDRYISITKPLKYEAVMTRRRARKIVISLWMYTIIVGIIPLFWNYFDERMDNPCIFFVIFPRPYTVFVTYVSMFVSLVLSFYLYLRIFQVAKEHRKRQIERRTIQYRNSSEKRFNRNTKSAKSMAIILFMFFVFWLPLQITGPLGYTNLDPDLVETLKDFALCLAMSNSFVNPIIYCWLRKDFKLAFKKLFKLNYENISLSGSYSDNRDGPNNSNRREKSDKNGHM